MLGKCSIKGWSLEDLLRINKKHTNLYHLSPTNFWCVFHVVFEWIVFGGVPYQLPTFWFYPLQLQPFHQWSPCTFTASCRPGADHGVPGEVVHSPRSMRPNVSADHWRQHASHVTQLRVAYLPGSGYRELNMQGFKGPMADRIDASSVLKKTAVGFFGLHYFFSIPKTATSNNEPFFVI